MRYCKNAASSVSANETAAQKWNLTYTDVINYCTQRVVPILETPSGNVAVMLEQHRLDGEARKSQRAGRLRG